MFRHDLRSRLPLEASQESAAGFAPCPRSYGLLAAVAAIAILLTAPGVAQEGPGEDHCADLNGDVRVDLSDAVFLLNYLFQGGTPPTCQVSGEQSFDGNCSNVAALATRSCRLGALADLRTARARCEVLTGDALEECRAVALAGYREELELCEDVLEAKLEICEELGESTHAPVIDPERFTTVIDNPYLPLTRGTTRVYEAETDEGLERIEVTATFESREVLGVECVVVRDTVTLDGEVIEDTYDWYAQDDEGNVWYFGELSFELEDGDIIGTAGSWEAGVDGAQPGIICLANPTVDRLYRQELLVGEAEDMARVLATDARVEIGLGVFEECLQTLDFTPLDPDPATFEHKFYARGLGLVLEIKPGTGERLELVESYGFDGPTELEDGVILIEHQPGEEAAHVEIVVGADDGLVRVQLLGPEGDRVVELLCREPGYQDFRLETPESELGEILEDYPEGEYLFVGWLESGQLLTRVVEISHELPDAPTITAPEEEAEVAGDSVTIAWDPVDGAVAYRVKIDDVDRGALVYSVEVSASAVSQSVPLSLLRPGVEHSIEVAAIGVSGNRTVTDRVFSTAP